jgi:hypothetical protein
LLRVGVAATPPSQEDEGDALVAKIARAKNDVACYSRDGGVAHTLYDEASQSLYCRATAFGIRH